MKLRENEIDLARKLIEQLSADEFHPEQYKDEYRDRVKAAIERKVAGEEVTVQEAPPARAQVIDLMEALKQSLGARTRGEAGEGEGRRRRPPARGGAPAGAKRLGRSVARTRSNVPERRAVEPRVRFDTAQAARIVGVPPAAPASLRRRGAADAGARQPRPDAIRLRRPRPAAHDARPAREAACRCRRSRACSSRCAARSANAPLIGAQRLRRRPAASSPGTAPAAGSRTPGSSSSTSTSAAS